MIAADYRHGLRVSELVDLRWAQVDFVTANLQVRRVKQGTPSSQRAKLFIARLTDNAEKSCWCN